MCVHTRHCCRVHGCKYGENTDCAVWLGIATQEGPCEQCHVDFDGNTPKVKFSDFIIRNRDAGHSRDYYSGRDDFFVES